MEVDRDALNRLRIERDPSEEQAGRPWVKWVVLACLIGAAALIGVLTLAGEGIEVEVAEVERASGSGTRSQAILDANGYVTARRQATVSSKVTGKVIEVLVEEGMRVEQGQLLARIDPATPAASLRLAQAQEKAAESALGEIEVRLEEARVELRRATRLASEEIAAGQDLDRARAEVAALEARLAAKRDELEVARRMVRVRDQDVSDTEIRAPFAGVVVSKNAQEGEMISPMSAGGGFTRTGICTVVDMSSLEIEVDVNEAYINRVSAGQQVEATLDAYPEWRISAHVITVVPTADRQKATVRVRIALDETDVRILPDMGVKVAFISRDPEGASATAALVPREAVHRDGERDIVWVVSGNRVERRAISVGGADGPMVRVTAGLSPGETVVTSSGEDLADGAEVKIVREKTDE